MEICVNNNLINLPRQTKSKGYSASRRYKDRDMFGCLAYACSGVICMSTCKCSVFMVF